ncbi:hypothetical protein, partial [Nocardia wallacei]|uniref:hypothetical protein n=1 Tax=Nocardia wallacei TaxID=480035 RepID=UPI0024587BA6
MRLPSAADDGSRTISGTATRSRSRRGPAQSGRLPGKPQTKTVGSPSVTPARPARATAPTGYR